MTNEQTREARVRRQLARNGERLWKPRGRHEAEYGPYAVIDLSTNAVMARGCTLDDLEADPSAA